MIADILMEWYRIWVITESYWTAAGETQTSLSINDYVKILQPNFEVIEPVYGCKEDKNSWCYLNYLQLPNAILLPVLSEKADCENDVAAIEYFKGLFPHLEIVPIYALPLIKKGGALHCVTWEYIEPKTTFLA